MNNIDIKLEGCSTDLIVRSTLESLKVFHDEILNTRDKLSAQSALLEAEKALSRKYFVQIQEYEKQLKDINQNVQTYQKDIETLKTENETLKNKSSQLESDNIKLNDEIKNSAESHSKEISEAITNHELYVQELLKSYAAELSNRDKNMEEMESSNESLRNANTILEDKLSNLSSIILRLLKSHMRKLSKEIHSLLATVKSENIKIWIAGILDKGEGSEMKGLDSFDEIDSLELLTRNVTFRNSFFSDIATLLLWASNDEIRDKISSEFNWMSLKNSFEGLLSAMKDANIVISYPNNYADEIWLDSAECATDKEKQYEFQDYFGFVESIKKNDPIFITSIAMNGQYGSYIKFYAK